MKKIMNWLSNSFAPKMNKICGNPWVDTVSSTMMKVLPFILTGSLIFFYNVFRSYLDFLPDLSIIADYSFGLLGLIISFLCANQAMKKLGFPRYEISAGIVSLAVFLMYIKPTITPEGLFQVEYSRMGPTGILVGVIAGLFTAVIFNLYSKLHILENNTTLPDFVSEWINNIIPITTTLAISMVLCFNFDMDIFALILKVFQPISSFGQTLPGFILLCFIPVFFYSMGISSWLFGAVTTPIFLAGIAENIAAVEAGGVARNIVTTETIFTAALITMGGMGATLCLNILMLKAKSRKLNVMGKICIGPSIFNINEPLMFGAPVVFNPLLMVPMWINSIVAPIIVWISMRSGFLNIPSKMIQVGQIPAPISSVMITEDFRAIFVYIILFVVYMAIWYPFFKVYDKQCLEEEMKQVEV